MSWQPAGNLKGPSGTATIDDPLVVDNAVYVGTDLRITKLYAGGKVEVRNPTTNVWSTTVTWSAT
jgi:hypothetical protein